MVNTTGNKINSLQESVRVVETRILGSVECQNRQVYTGICDSKKARKNIPLSSVMFLQVGDE